MKKLFVFAFVVFAFLFAPFAPNARALTLSLEPTFSTIGVGGIATVDLNISGFASGTAPSLGAFGVEVVFDSSILSFDSVSFGSSLGIPDTDFGFGIDPPFETDIFLDTFIPGVVLLDEFSFLFDFELDSLQPESFTLATLSFSGTAQGTSTLDFGLVDLSDAFGSTLVPSLSFASVSVGVAPPSSVPEPSTLLLLTSGLVGLAIIKKRANKKKDTV